MSVTVRLSSCGARHGLLIPRLSLLYLDAGMQCDSSRRFVELLYPPPPHPHRPCGHLQSRIHWMSTFGERFGGPSAAEALLKGKGVSLILKSIQVNFRRPVTHPDTVSLSLMICTSYLASSSPWSLARCGAQTASARLD